MSTPDSDQVLTIDLSYAEAHPPPGLVDHLRRKGRSHRRRRRTLAAAGAVTAVVLAISGANALTGSPPDRGAQPAVQLPPAQRDARAAVRWPDGVTQYVYMIDDDGLPMLCAGNLPDPADADPFSDEKTATGRAPAACGSVSTNGPGFRGGGATTPELDGHPVPAGKHRYFTYGHVLGPVSRVTVEIRGVTHEASLARSTDPQVGTLYGVAVLLDQPLNVRDRVVHTAYLGDRMIDREGGGDEAAGGAHGSCAPRRVRACW